MEIARTFLQPHYSVIKVEEPLLQDEVWVVEVRVSIDDMKITVDINSKTGYIKGWFKHR